MPSYNKFKEKFQEHKPKIILFLCFVLVFFVGFGTGKLAGKKTTPRDKVQSYYTTKQQNPPETAAPATDTPVPTVSSTPPAATNCLIKGNIASGGRKIYHVPGGAFYKTVKPEQCFNTEAEAQAAGYIKSQR